MKKLTNWVRTINIVIALTMLVGCNSISRSTYHHDYYDSMAIWMEAEEERIDDLFSISSEATEEQQESVLKIFQRLKETYKDKEAPNVRTISEQQLQEKYGSNAMMIQGVYGGEKTIYIEEELSNGEGNSVIAHELCHYLSGERGISYVVENYKIGNALNEGLTNYFSTKLYPHPEGASVYELETFIAKQLAEIIGEEAMEEMFFECDISQLREDFNSYLADAYQEEEQEGVVFTPFDILCGKLETYRVALSLLEEYDDMLTLCMSSADCVEEMVLNYAETKGKKSECQELLSEFIANEQQIEWSTYSHLGNML